ncbi:MAG: hypothetical protein HQK81_15170 [Desulfovibrionaceae bacterium]|nr:hypothetical protein [Desulfovibrionaceae bacterium]
MVDSEWVTVTEASRRLGITRTAIYNRIKRGTLQTQTDNHGHQLVNIAVTVTRDTLRHVARDTVTPPLNQDPPPEHTQPRHDAPESVPVSVLRETVASLRDAHRATLDAIERLHQDQVEMLVERIDRAELMIERLLEERRRPWWAFWR